MTTTTARPNFKLISNPNAVGMTPSGNKIGKFELRVIDKLSGNGDMTKIMKGQEVAAEFSDDRWTDPAWEARHRPDNVQS